MASSVLVKNIILLCMWPIFFVSSQALFFFSCILRFKCTVLCFWIFHSPAYNSMVASFYILPTRYESLDCSTFLPIFHVVRFLFVLPCWLKHRDSSVGLILEYEWTTKYHLNLFFSLPSKSSDILFAQGIFKTLLYVYKFACKKYHSADMITNQTHAEKLMAKAKFTSAEGCMWCVPPT
jgi:hypothetical protein